MGGARAQRARDIRLVVDRPAIVKGAAAPVRGSLSIQGWALARGGVAAVDVHLDGRRFGRAYYGIRRNDIGAAFPRWNGAASSGFGLMIRAGALDSGKHRIGIVLHAKSGLVERLDFTIEVQHAEPMGGPGIPRRKMPLSERQLSERILSGLGWHPRFQLLLGIGEIDDEIEAARQTLASLREQEYGDWRATIVRRGRVAPDRAEPRLMEEFEDIAGRIDIRLDAAAATLLTELARAPPGSDGPELIGVLLAGDVLGCDALLEMAIASGLNPEAELFYSDERRTSPASGRGEAFFKPQWSPDLLLSTNYIGRFWCALAGVVQRSGATLGDWFRFGDYDLVLRCTEATDGIFHVPRVLCERGRAQLDHPDQERTALDRARQRRGIRGAVEAGAVSGHYRMRRTVGTRRLVSIVIATRAAGGLVRPCIETLRTKTAYRDFEIVCVENIPASQPEWKDWLRENANRVVSPEGPFNWSRFNNLGAQAASGDFLLFLNDDTEIIEADWLEALLAHAERPEIGAVGGRLLYPDRKVQHAGMIWTAKGGRHAFRLAAETDPGYFGLALAERDVIAVTGACLMTSRAAFAAQGGFDESHAIVNNDVDYCLRCRERGQRVVYTPYATLIHHELASRHDFDDDFDAPAFARRWARQLEQGDPFYPARLTRDLENFSADPEPLELVHSARPLFAAESLRRILAVKLDHIGDFVIAIPALKRLQARFPHSSLSLLAAPGSAALAQFLPGIEEIIEFEFFFPRSGLGQRSLSGEALAALRRRLAPYRFDLAIDLRKAPETRPILQMSGARWLAGFDHAGMFPWLDIVMEWEQDPAAMRKRSHVGDDLLRLVDAIATATVPSDAILPSASAAATEAARGSCKRLVCIHPGVGSAIRQWPPPHFAALIDRLAAAHDVEIVLIGSDDEAPIAAEVIAHVQRRETVRSLAGEVSLRDLPALLARAALFVGNNSGPKHLAAGLGVPTVGIHSGTVDAREWGPTGANAVAIRRDMVCSPCYLSDPADCQRGLACLTELTPSDVYEVCRRMLAIDPARRP